MNDCCATIRATIQTAGLQVPHDAGRPVAASGAGGGRRATGPWTVVALVVAAMAAGGVARQAAAETVYYMQGTGVGANLVSSSQRDQNWNIVALPTTISGSFANPESGYPPYPATPYQAWVGRTTNINWVNGSPTAGAAQVGTTVSGSTYYWIGANSTFAPVTTGTYKWIVAQTFNVTQAGIYDFNFTATVDNELTFFVGGALNYDDPQQPTIVGGTQIGTTLSGTGKFRELWNFQGAAPLAVGQNTAYAVVRDWGAVTGVTITESSYVLVTPVPEPSTWAMAVAAIACGGWRVCRRRRPACRTTVETVSPAHSGP